MKKRSGGVSLSRLVAALFILPFISLSASAQKLKIIYASGGQFSLSPNIIGALEALLLEDAAHIRLDKVEMRTAYASNGHYTLELSSDVKKELLPRNGAQRKIAQEIDILENSRAIAFVQPKTYYPLLDNLFTISTSPAFTGFAGGKNPSKGRLSQSSDDGFTPGVRKAKAYLGEIKGGADESIPLLIRDQNKMPASWAAAAVWRYFLTVDGRPVTVTIIGKPLGGTARTKTALSEKLPTIKEPKLLLVTGSLFQPGNLTGDAEMVSRTFEELGFDAAFPHDGDLELGWDSIAAKKDNSRFPKIISNLRAQDGAEVFYKPWIVKEIGGVRVGVFSLISKEADVFLMRKNLPYRVEDAIRSAKDILKELRGNQKVDLTICISNQKREDDARMLVEVPDIDILIGGYSREISTKRKNRTEFSGWRQETHFWPAAQTISPTFGYGEMTLEFEPSAAGPELSAVENRLFAFGEETQEDAELSVMSEKVLDVYVKPQEPLLPDPRHLWPLEFVKISYGALEFWNLAAQALRFHEKTEAAFVRIRPLGSRVPGSPSEGFLWEWLMPDQRVALVRVSGRALRSLLARVDFDEVGRGNNRSDESKYVAQSWLAAAGVDKEGKISGIPIKDAEFYQVAVAEELLKTREFSELNSGVVKKHEHSLAAAILDWLKKRKQLRDETARDIYHESLRRALKSEADKTGPELRLKLDEAFSKEKNDANALAQKRYEDDIRHLAEGRTPEKLIWRLNLRELSGQFSNTFVENRAAYPGVPNARIQAVNQVMVRGVGKIFSELFWKRLTWNTGLTLDYGRLTLKPENLARIQNETVDQIIGETDLTYRAANLNGKPIHANIGPFVNLSEESEFTKPLLVTGLPRRQLLRAKSGIKIYQGRFLQELSLGALYQRNYAKQPKDSDTGWETVLSWLSPLPKSNVLFQFQANYRRIEPDSTDTVVDLRSELGARASLKIPFWSQLNFSPFVDLYRFEGQLGQSAGKSILFGVALDFSRLWKW